MSRKIFDMDLDFYKQIIDDCPFAETVFPYGIGEPLLYPHIIEAIRYAKKKGKKVILYSNASLLTRELSYQLLNVGLDQLFFSVDGYDVKTFGSRIGGDWFKIYKNILFFENLKRKKGYKTKTQIRGCLTSMNRFHIQQFKRFWLSIVDAVTVMPIMKRFKESEINKNKFVSYKAFKEKCFMTTKELTILNSGDVIICCNDCYGKYVLGNAHAEKPLTVFNNSEFNRTRDNMLKGEIPLICVECDTIKRWSILYYLLHPQYSLDRLVSKIMF